MYGLCFTNSQKEDSQEQTQEDMTGHLFIRDLLEFLHVNK